MTTPLTLPSYNSTTLATTLSNITPANYTPILTDSVANNKQTSIFSLSTSTQLSASTVQSVNQVSAVRDISYQILAEPLRAIDTNGAINTNIAANTTMAQAVLNAAPTQITNVTALSQDPNALNSQLKDGLSNAAKKSATIAQTEATHAELAHGHKIESIAGSHTLKSNSIRHVSDTTHSIHTPHSMILAQDHQVQANNSYTVIAGVNLEQYNQQVSLVQGSIIAQAQTGVNVFTNTLDNVSNNTRSIGLQSHTTMGAQNTIMADNTISHISGGDIQSAAYGNVGVQSNGNISIVAANSNSTSPVSASSDGSTLASAIAGGSIMIVATPNTNSTNIFSLSDQGMLSSTTQNMVSTSGGLNVVNGTQGSLVFSNQFSYVGNNTSGVYVKGNKTYIGSIPIPVSNVTPPKINSIPSLPKMPKLPTNQLANCLPKPATTTNTNNSIGTAVTTNPIQTTGSFACVSCTQTTATTNTAKVPTSINNMNLPTQSNGNTNLPAVIPTNPNISSNVSSNKSINNTSTLGNATVKLPVPASSTFSNSSLSSAPIFADAITGIYIDKYNPNSNQTNQSTMLGITSNPATNTTAVSTLINNAADQAATQSLASAMNDSTSYFTITNITNALSGSVPANILPDFLVPNFYIQLLQLPPSKVSSFSFTSNDFPQLNVTSILQDISNYPAVKQAILTLLSNSQAPVAIGGLLGLNFNFNGISNIESSIVNLTKIPNLVSNKNLASTILGVVTPTVNSALAGTPFSQLLANPKLIGLPTTGANGVSTSTAISNAVNTLFNTAVTNAIKIETTQILGSTASSAIYNAAIPSIISILNNINTGKPINPNNYINQFATILGAISGKNEAALATNVYKNLQGLISNINSGDITKVLTGGNLQSLLSTILGPSASGQLAPIFNTIKSAVGAYQAFSLLPQLIKLMNQYNIPTINQVGIALNCLDLFNKVNALINSLGALNNGSNGNQATAALLENAPAMVQATNTINSLSPDDLSTASTNLSQQLGTPINLADYNVNLNQELDQCFNLPQLNNYESQVDITYVQNGVISFNLINYSVLLTNPSSLPSVNDTIQVRVNGFLDTTTNNYLVPYQTDYQYTPSIYNFIISAFDSVNNIGTAVFDNSISSIVLQSTNTGVLYQYPTQAIGRILNLDIQEAFILI